MFEIILKEIERNLTTFSISPVIPKGTNVCREIQCYYEWLATPKVKCLKIVLEPMYRNGTQPIELFSLYPSKLPRSISKKLPHIDGLYKTSIWAVLDSGTEVATNFVQTAIMLGVITPPRYLINHVGGGWSLLKLVHRGHEVYRNLLYVKYDNCTYPYPLENGIPAGDCYIPSWNEIMLITEDKLLPQPVCKS